jgi:hypothetical protein
MRPEVSLDIHYFSALGFASELAAWPGWKRQFIETPK